MESLSGRFREVFSSGIFCLSFYICLFLDLHLSRSISVPCTVSNCMMYIYIYIQTRPISSLNPYIIHISTDIYLSISAYVYLFLALLLVGLQQWVSAFVQHGLLNGDLSGQHLVNSNGLADFTQFGSHRLDVCHSVHSYMIYTEPVTWYAKPPKIGGWKKLLSYKFEDLEYPGICVCVFALVWGMVFIFFHFCLEGMFSYYLYTFIYIYIL